MTWYVIVLWAFVALCWRAGFAFLDRDEAGLWPWIIALAWPIVWTFCPLVLATCWMLERCGVEV